MLQCESIISEEEDHVVETFAKTETSREEKMTELCVTRTKICEPEGKPSGKKKVELWFGNATQPHVGIFSELLN